MKTTTHAIIALITLSGTLAVHADVITDFNAVMLQATKNESTMPPKASRNMAIVSLAVYDAVNSIDQSHQSYLGTIAGASSASADAAAAKAARDALVELYPAQQALFDAEYNRQLNMIADSAAKSQGIAVGAQAAANILAARAYDGSTNTVIYTPKGTIGSWQPTPNGVNDPALPHWGSVQTFGVQSSTQFMPPPPPALTSQQYADAFNEVKNLGRNTGSTRTADQTNIARFWAAGNNTVTPPGMWKQIATTLSKNAGLSTADNARLFALLNMAAADAGITCWEGKYTYDTWRPVTAIRMADQDGNALTDVDANWLPLINTPSFPEYASGHSTFSAAAAAILAAFFGTDNLTFTVESSIAGIDPRTFASLSDAAHEASMSRIYGGIHFRFACEQGLISGNEIGNYIFNSYFAAVPTPASAGLLGLGALAATRRRRA
jgi:hypothetical protein